MIFKLRASRAVRPAYWLEVLDASRRGVISSKSHFSAFTAVSSRAFGARRRASRGNERPEFSDLAFARSVFLTGYTEKSDFNFGAFSFKREPGGGAALKTSLPFNAVLSLS